MDEIHENNKDIKYVNYCIPILNKINIFNKSLKINFNRF